MAFGLAFSVSRGCADMGFDQLPIPGPYRGIVDNLPRPTKPINAWDDLLNFMPYKGRLQTRNKLSAFGNPPDSSLLRKILTYSDILGNPHTLALTIKTAYAITTGPVYNMLTNPMGVTDLTGTSFPYGIAITNGRVYFSNGSVVGVYTDGQAALQVAGDIPGAFRYAGILANHMIICYTTEPAPGNVGSASFPQRVRWSNVGDANSWTPGPSTSAGFTDLLEVPDDITGFATLGRSGYVFRSNGISLVTPTGIGTSPFQFDQVTNSPQGVGCFYPYSLDTYGGISAFVGQQDVYLFDGTSFTPIGGEAKKKIFADIANSTGDVITGQICPNLGTGFDYLAYYLTIPGNSNGLPITWVYSWDDQGWWRFSSSSGELTAIGSVLV